LLLFAFQFGTEYESVYPQKAPGLNFMVVPIYTLDCHVFFDNAWVPIIGKVVPNGMSGVLPVVVVGAGVGTTQGVIVRTRPEEVEHVLAAGQPVHCS
jgi:hypothetical protein